VIVSSDGKAETGERSSGVRAQLIVTSFVCAVAVPAFVFFLAFERQDLEPMLWSGGIALLAAGNLARLMRRALPRVPESVDFMK
jgi:hypothetical protein